jgi:hypothetical protein
VGSSSNVVSMKLLTKTSNFEECLVQPFIVMIIPNKIIINNEFKRTSYPFLYFQIYSQNIMEYRPDEENKKDLEYTPLF